MASRGTTPSRALFTEVLKQADKKTASELRFMGRTLIENRNGLIVNAMVTQADGHAEREAARAMAELRPPRGLGDRRVARIVRAHGAKHRLMRTAGQAQHADPAGARAQLRRASWASPARNAARCIRTSRPLRTLAAFQAGETTKWRDLVKAANIKPD